MCKDRQKKITNRILIFMACPPSNKIKVNKKKKTNVQLKKVRRINASSLLQILWTSVSSHVPEKIGVQPDKLRQ